MTFPTRTCIALLALAPAGTLALPAIAEEMKFMAELTGAAQVPPVETAATGMADITVDTEAMTISWIVTYEGMSTDPGSSPLMWPVAAHVHGPATPEETGPMVFNLTADLEGAAGGADEPLPLDIMEGSSELTEEQLADLRAGLLYINIHTPQNNDGEIRGQVVEGEAAIAKPKEQ